MRTHLLGLLAINLAASSVALLEFPLNTADGAQWRVSSGAHNITATVPGDVNWDLVDSGILPDLLVGTQSMGASWVPALNWTYTTHFVTDPVASAGIGVASVRERRLPRASLFERRRVGAAHRVV